MKHTIQLTFILVGTVLLSGCSEKSFTLQSYADEYFNDKNTTTKNISQAPARDNESSTAVTSSSNIDDKTTNPGLKEGPGADIAWSSTYKQDKKTEGKGAIQQSLDTWLEEEWNPTFENDPEQAKKEEAAKKHFTLQHYYDKRIKYLESEEKKQKASGKPKEPAHYEKMEKMPVIGK